MRASSGAITLLFAIRVNSAIAKLGINPADIKAEYRQGAQAFGKRYGYSPQEVALFVVSNLPMDFHFGVNVGTIRTWIRKRKINPQDPEMRNALDRLALWHLLQ
jgi:hypothetical protein